MKYNGTDYIYVKDALGNIVEVVNSSGVSQAKYAYDAWASFTCVYAKNTIENSPK